MLFLLWKQAFALIKTKQTKAYDEAVKLLTELRDLAQHLDRPALPKPQAGQGWSHTNLVSAKSKKTIACFPVFSRG